MTSLGLSALPVPRGARRRQRTRTAILNAGEKLFADRAMESVTIDDIVEAAEVAKGSFYNHFDDKEGLAAAIVKLVQGDSEFHIYAANRGIVDSAERIVRSLCVMVRYGLAHPERLQAMLTLANRGTIPSPLNANLVAYIEDGIKAERFAGVTVETGILSVLGMIRITIVHAMTEQSATTPADLAVGMGAALLRALGVKDPEAMELARTASQDLLKEAAP